MSEVATYLEADPFSRGLVGRRLGRYEVLAQLATGGMASIYAARAVGVAGFERLFAVKVLHPHLAHEREFISMFLEEARLAARIRHPNVVPTTDISDTADAGYYLVMDYVEGDHLGALLQSAHADDTRIAAPVALRIVIDALQGLAAAHGLPDAAGQPLGIVHRDISPHNIMVGNDGIARITDFGVAKCNTDPDVTQSGQFKGKLAYMAPEHAARGDADQRSDLFSMSVVLWETLTGRRLFRAENQAATLNRVCLEPIPMPSEVDPALAPFDVLLAKGLSRDPAERFQTADAFADALEANAPALGGIASQRMVARVVQRYAADKMSRDQKLITDAIAKLSDRDGDVEVAPDLAIEAAKDLSPSSTPLEPTLEPPTLGAPTGAVFAPVTPPATDPETVAAAAVEAWTGATPTTTEPTNRRDLEVLVGSRRPSRKTPWIAAGLVLLAIALTALWFGGAPRPIHDTSALTESPDAPTDVEAVPAGSPTGTAGTPMPSEPTRADSTRDAEAASGADLAHDAAPTGVDDAANLAEDTAEAEAASAGGSRAEAAAERRRERRRKARARRRAATGSTASGTIEASASSDPTPPKSSRAAQTPTTDPSGSAAPAAAPQQDRDDELMLNPYVN